MTLYQKLIQTRTDSLTNWIHCLVRYSCVLLYILVYSCILLYIFVYSCILLYILVDDMTRVRLKTASGTGDYINANHVDVS